MDHKTAVEKLVAVEREVDVNGFQYQGVCVWPVVRRLLYPCFLRGKKAGKALTGNRRSIFLKGFDAIAACLPKALRIQTIHHASLNMPKSRLNWLREQAGQHEVLFFCQSKEYQDELDGQHYNRFSDPFIDFFSGKISIGKVELSDGISNQITPRKHDAIVLEPAWETRTVKLKKKVEIQGWNELSQSFRNICPCPLEETVVVQYLEAINRYKNLFIEVFSALRPKVVFLACYYHPIGMGLIQACHVLGVPTVDYQHGKQGKFHGMYTHWTAMPGQGYELLPDWFWVWGEESKDNIERHQPAGIARHRAVVGGNLWLSGWVHGKIHMDAGQEREVEEVLAGRKAILVSLQPLDNPIPEFCLEAMAKSPQDWIWLLRTHPLYRDRINEIGTMLRVRGISNCEVRSASELPLHALLKKSSHHVTAFSSVCYEALAFGLRTTLFHPTAKNLYEDYLEKELFTFVDSAESLLDAIEKSLITSPPVESNPYIMTDIATIQSAMHEVMQ